MSMNRFLRAAGMAAATVAVKVSPVFTVEGAQEAQTILGLGFEIQSDSIGSGNHGMPNETTSVPWDLTPSERTRFYESMLTGFRYCRLALGLYFRGLTPDNRSIIERWPGQADALADMATRSGLEGFEVEYWSPAPGWKSTGSFIDGSLTGFDPATLDAFSKSVVGDALYLEEKGLTVTWWGLQNEPPVGPNGCIYSCAGYNSTEYYLAQKATASAIRAALPHTAIHASSWSGQHYSPELATDPEALANIDAWTFHRVGADSNDQLDNEAFFLSGTAGKPVFNNEFEYLGGGTTPARMLNTAQSIMNWLAIENAPSWYWLHALKPLGNSESKGYGLGYWNPAINGSTKPSDPPPGHWEYNPYNWNAVAGFVRYMPWDSVRLNVTEDERRPDVRVLAYRFDPARAQWLAGPAGEKDEGARRAGATLATLRDDSAARAAATKLAVVLSNRLNVSVSITVQLADNPGSAALPTLSGHLYAPNVTDGALGSVVPTRNATTGVPYFVASLEPLQVQFWVEE